MSAVLLLASVSILTVGGIFCLLSGRDSARANRLGGAVAVAGAVPAIISAAYFMWNGLPSQIKLAWSIPFGSFYVAVDGLSAFFVLAIAIIAGLAAIYGVAYLKNYSARKNLGASWFFYNVLFASMLVVVTAKNGVLFLIAWELMSLASFFLVMFEHEHKEVREAGWTYLTATHLGTAFLFALFVLLGWQNQTMDFDQFAAPSASMASVFFILAVIGFGTKAGFMPLHVWLPEAHPAAPSHVSAVMSGVMIKTGIYGLLRTMTFMGPAEMWPAWWGWTLIGIGAVSGIGGVLFALAQHDIKRLLAYHSVENIGIICLGLGLWLLGTSTGNPALATLGLLGGLLHVWNHAIFKSLLFFGAGSVVHATGARDIERFGGLLKKMPQTGLAFLVGSIAICGLPPLNGFVSEFLIYAGAFSGIAQGGGPATVAGLVTVASLALIGGLAIACFTKVFGIVFLGEGRSADVERAHEAPASMRAPMLILAGVCLFIGLLGPLVIHSIELRTAGLFPLKHTATVNTTFNVTSALWHISAGFGILIVIIAGLWLLRRKLLAKRVIEQTGTWDCGYAAPNARMQYTASSFASPILDMFSMILCPKHHRELPAGIFPEEASYASHTDDVFRQKWYAPIFRSALWLSERLRWVQEGRNQLYVLYIALTLLILLIWKMGFAI